MPQKGVEVKGGGGGGSLKGRGVKGRGSLILLKPEGEFIIYCRG
jgi:hypothetical protein